jgi:hypothetical protein
MTPINYMEFCDNDNLIFEFNHRNLIEKVWVSPKLDIPFVGCLFLPVYRVTFFGRRWELRSEEEQNGEERQQITRLTPTQLNLSPKVDLSRVQACQVKFCLCQPPRI